ncbi:hypothetical protein WJX74_000061 [Apatococcus lobatus]|uniref:GATA-type domain-containing protein n=1 Tax=Apatococcus lobatus TaxID=904363 RepID=A0AAW1R350_9CHLO
MRMLEDDETAAPMEDEGSRLECKQCGTSKTPMWRSGPLGPKTLCNACGVRAQRAQQRTRTGSASNSPNKDKAGLPPPPKKAEAPLQQLPSKTTIRLPAKTAAQPARPLSQRISKRQPSRNLSDEDISSSDDDLEDEPEPKPKAARYGKRKLADMADGSKESLRSSSRATWHLTSDCRPPSAHRQAGLGGSGIMRGAYPSPGSQASGQSVLDQGHKSSLSGPERPGHSPTDPSRLSRQISNGNPQSLSNSHTIGLPSRSQQAGSSAKLASLPGHLVMPSKTGLARVPNIRLHIRVASLGGGPPAGLHQASGKQQLLVLSCTVQDGREVVCCAIPRQGLSVSMPVANPNGNGFRWESPQRWMVILPDRQSAVDLTGILQKWFGASADSMAAPAQQAGSVQARPQPGPLHHRPFGEQCKWDFKADQPASQWWAELLRKNAGRNLPGPGLPLSLDLLERVMDTLELASASLALPQGIPESAARIILGSCRWAPAGVVCKSVFLYWLERRQGRPLQGFGADHLWQRTWPSIWQPTHPFTPLAGTLLPALGHTSRQPAESVLSNRLSPEGSQVATSTRPATAGCARSPQPETDLPASPAQLQQNAFPKAASAPCGFLSNFVPQDRPQSATSLDADFADAICGDEAGGPKGSPALSHNPFPGSPLLIHPPLVAQIPQHLKVKSQESASASPGTSESHQHSVSDLSTALSAPLFPGASQPDHLVSHPDELDMIGNFELAGSELLADVEAAAPFTDIFSPPQPK